MVTSAILSLIGLFATCEEFPSLFSISLKAWQFFLFWVVIAWFFQVIGVVSFSLLLCYWLYQFGGVVVSVSLIFSEPFFLVINLLIHKMWTILSTILHRYFTSLKM